MTTERERRLIERARTDRDAFAVLYREHYEAIGGYLFRRIGDACATEDLLGDVFLSALQALPRFEPRGVPFRAWLLRIATYAREPLGARERPRPRPLSERAGVVRRRGVGDGGARPLGRAVVGAALPAAVAPRFQAVLALHYVEGLSVEEVARTLHCRPGAVIAARTRPRRARRARWRAQRAEKLTMEYGNDPLDEVIPRLASLRELSWDRPDHRERLEMRLMNSNRSLGRCGGSRRRAALFLGVVLLGGAAAGATTMWILSGVAVEPGTPDGQGNCTWIITHPDGTQGGDRTAARGLEAGSSSTAGTAAIDLVGVEKVDDAAGDGLGAVARERREVKPSR